MINYLLRKLLVTYGMNENEQYQLHNEYCFGYAKFDEKNKN